MEDNKPLNEDEELILHVSVHTKGKTYEINSASFYQGSTEQEVRKAISRALLSLYAMIGKHNG